MIEIITFGLKALAEIGSQWIGASEQERADLERRALDGIQVLRGERKVAHEEINARDVDTRRVIDEEKARLDREKTKP